MQNGGKITMNVVNEQVHHSKFGAGTVVNQTENVVEVEFCEEYGLKKFVYPSAFDGHLTLCNDLLQGQVDDELKDVREQADAEKRHHEEEVQKRLEEERIAAAEQKKTTRKRASTKSTTKKVSVKAHDNIEEQEM